MYKLPKAEQSAWAADMGAVAINWYAKLTGDSAHTAADPTNILLCFTDIGRLIAWSARFPNKTIVAKIDAWDEAAIMDDTSDFAVVEMYIQAHRNVTRFYMELKPNATVYTPWTFER